jgi:hypothetical protein
MSPTTTLRTGVPLECCEWSAVRGSGCGRWFVAEDQSLSSLALELAHAVDEFLVRDRWEVPIEGRLVV